MANTASFSEHLIPGLKEIVGTALGGRKSVYSRITRVDTSDRNFEEYLAAAGLPAAAIKPELVPIQSYDPLEGSKKRMTHTVYAIGFEVSEEAWEDDLYAGKGSALREAGTGLADSLAETVEIEAHRLYGADSFLTSAVPSYIRPLPDLATTISLYNTAHGAIAGGEAGTQSNRPATFTDLNVTAYRAALTQFRKWTDDRGKRIPGFTEPALLVCSPDLEWDAREIVQSTNRPDTSNLVENVTRGMTEVVPTPYITDDDAWFVIGRKHFLTFLWRWRPRMDSFDDRRSRAAVFVGYERFDKAAVHWLGTYASQGI